MSEGFGPPYDDEELWEQDPYLARLQTERQELAEIDFMEDQIEAKAYQRRRLEEALEGQAEQEAAEEGLAVEILEDALEAQEEHASALGQEIEEAERERGQRFSPDTIDHLVSMAGPDEHLADAAERLLPKLDPTDPGTRRMQLAQEIEIDRMERGVDQTDDDAALPPEAEEELDPAEADELAEFKAGAIAERRQFERTRRPLTDSEAAELTENVLEARAAGDTSYTLHEAEKDSFLGPPPNMRDPDERRQSLADVLAEEMEDNGEWGRDEQTNWEARHPNE